MQLTNWVNAIKRTNPEEITETEDKLNSLFGQLFTETTIAQRHELYTRLHSLLAQEEAFWHQRSKENWLQLGDQNTKYFHQKTNRRRRRNGLHGLFDEAGVWHEDKSGMESVIVDYFTKLFHSQGVTDATEILQVVNPKVSLEMNQELLRPISNKEIKEALFQMHPTKAPRHDGMSPGFYQKHWKIVGQDVCDGTSSKTISKLAHPNAPVGYGLCFLNLAFDGFTNATQDSITASLGFKIARGNLLPEVVSPSQSAFIPGRLISDNCLVASKIAYYMHMKNNGWNGVMAMKLDISKACDRIEWSFFGANDMEGRVCGGVDSLDNYVCHYSIIFFQTKWGDGEFCPT